MGQKLNKGRMMDRLDGAFMKENFWFESERRWTEDCSLKKCSESLMIGIEKVKEGDPSATRWRWMSEPTIHNTISQYNTKNTIHTIQYTIQFKIQIQMHFWDDHKESPHLTSRRLKQSKIKNLLCISVPLSATTNSNIHKPKCKSTIYKPYQPKTWRSLRANTSPLTTSMKNARSVEDL